MGDRANIHILENTEERKGFYFYTHWGGYDLPGTLKAALQRGKGRWTDHAYLARIIFCEMVAGQEMSETGFGISLKIQDNEHDIIEVRMDEKRVVFRKYHWEDDRRIGLPIPGMEWTFEEYAEQGPENFGEEEED